MSEPPHLPMTEPQQREITRLCVESGLRLMQHGAESALIESLSCRLGLALGVRSVEVAVMANALILTTLGADHCITTVRRSADRGINMHVITEVQRAILEVEEGRLDPASYRAALEAVQPLRYPRWLLSLVIGLSCACFARLAEADVEACGLVFLASGLAMYVRLRLAKLHFSPLLTFFASAFVATSLAGLGLLLKLTLTPRIALATCVLFLVPGFPLINGVSDMVKGYSNIGLARLAWATLLSAASCGGILLAMTVWKLWGWP